ncbi:MAG: hypothetical protein A3I77_01990 [Gammaproteobacteria bacterium RIFCSPLOWO2_02_FULL_42_14]|nr:MAG: hypothetical protein A3B71_00695 [Gammaproteobacteria bacterium RIFCSPHIGHO2_02_FULL_42_43]OGT28276.1 MAG: hypothetical protein A2624_02220 [Gammaproteobacteria bacterium RIFCSPHIGHO2_01_FULL_42_8]OGT52128.1 MAG: hypothetical protein A3E54_06825 [Gammaproteobacteria bacterium RIFCSPHIGHO2_12_FULL_41_25]OGT62565.1 MAG: hypothetical protein A3I77_01990 [Gammaproteobacteria bacterium RIFCSPLOWO2_02_FULL_42_14]OGT86548.1 MAG: hypothetical protein A3G86_08510 [Gammaproteobacteria bacterium R
MSVKKILLLGAASIAAVSATAAVAGGYTHEPMSSGGSYYLEGHAGYARQNYLDNVRWRASSGVNTNSANNASGGFSGGFDAGYNFNRNYALELGWFYLPTVNTMTGSAVPAYLKSWAAYLAGKFMVPMAWMQDTDWFFKLGVAYRSATIPAAAQSSLAVTSGNSTYWHPMFATGLDYSFSDMFSGVAQYAYFMGSDKSFKFIAVNSGALGTMAANVFTLGLAYKFTV